MRVGDIRFDYLKNKTILLDYKSIVFGWTYDIFVHISSRRLYLNSLSYVVYIFQIIKYNMADEHSAGTKSEPMKFGTLSLSIFFLHFITSWAMGYVPNLFT